MVLPSAVLTSFLIASGVQGRNVPQAVAPQSVVPQSEPYNIILQDSPSGLIFKKQNPRYWGSGSADTQKSGGKFTVYPRLSAKRAHNGKVEWRCELSGSDVPSRFKNVGFAVVKQSDYFELCRYDPNTLLHHSDARNCMATIHNDNGKTKGKSMNDGRAYVYVNDTKVLFKQDLLKGNVFLACKKFPSRSSTSSSSSSPQAGRTALNQSVRVHPQPRASMLDSPSVKSQYLASVSKPTATPTVAKVVRAGDGLEEFVRREQAGGSRAQSWTSSPDLADIGEQKYPVSVDSYDYLQMFVYDYDCLTMSYERDFKLRALKTANEGLHGSWSAFKNLIGSAGQGNAKDSDPHQVEDEFRRKALEARALFHEWVSVCSSQTPTYGSQFQDREMGQRNRDFKHRVQMVWIESANLLTAAKKLVRDLASERKMSPFKSAWKDLESSSCEIRSSMRLPLRSRKDEIEDFILLERKAGNQPRSWTESGLEDVGAQKFPNRFDIMQTFSLETLTWDPARDRQLQELKKATIGLQDSLSAFKNLIGSAGRGNASDPHQVEDEFRRKALKTRELLHNWVSVCRSQTQTRDRDLSTESSSERRFRGDFDGRRMTVPIQSSGLLEEADALVRQLAFARDDAGNLEFWKTRGM